MGGGTDGGFARCYTASVLHGTIEIRTGEFLLRPWRDTDAASLAAHANNRKVWVNLRSTLPRPYTEENARRWIRQQGRASSASRALHLAIEIDGAAVGGLSVERDAPGRAEVGYWLGEAYWKRGIATSALEAVTDYAFCHLGLHRLQGVVQEANAASVRVLEKAGYSLVGRVRRSGRRPTTARLVELVYARERAAA